MNAPHARSTSLWRHPVAVAGVCLALSVLFLGAATFVATLAPRVLLVAGLVNLAIPAAHVVYTRIDPISPLPIEMFRVLRGG
jgi:hypothetical protein